MQHRDAAVELALNFRITGGREADPAELLVLLAECAAGKCCSDQAQGGQASPPSHVHRNLPCSRMLLGEPCNLCATSYRIRRSFWRARSRSESSKCRNEMNEMILLAS